MIDETFARGERSRPEAAQLARRISRRFTRRRSRPPNKRNATSTHAAVIDETFARGERSRPEAAQLARRISRRFTRRRSRPPNKRNATSTHAAVIDETFARGERSRPEAAQLARRISRRFTRRRSRPPNKRNATSTHAAVIDETFAAASGADRRLRSSLAAFRAASPAGAAGPPTSEMQRRIDMAVLDRPLVRDAVERSADPVRARAALERLVETHPAHVGDIVDDPMVLDGLVAVSVASRSLFLGFERDPGAIAMLRGDALTKSLSLDDAGDLLIRPDPPRELRIWKRRHVARIAARDLLGLADLRTVAHELADLASACLEVALGIAAPTTPMAVIGMGKLGGAELNYASDVDVLFVHDGDGLLEEAERVVRTVLRVMTEPGPDGIVFRTDIALRPEGRAGALSRTIEAYEGYWKEWARTWELQALLKARPVAGALALGELFIARAEPYVWPEVLDPDAVREVRMMKARTEELLRRQGVSDREIKRGYGGIRDIEFAVQLLQLVHGRADPNVRARATLTALEHLASGGYVSTVDATQLDEAYVWLRTVEHRLQLVDEHQTHTIPTDADARTHLARVLGFRDTPGTPAVDRFDGEVRRHQTVVRSIHEKLFFAPLLDTLAGVGALAEEAAEERLRAFGFTDIEQTRAALQELTAGLTRRSRVMQQLLPAILGWLSATPDPDLGLLQLRRLSEGYTRSSTLARRFRETPIAAERTCRVLGSSRVLGLSLHRHPDVVDALADDAFVTEEASHDMLTDIAVGTLDWRIDENGRRAGLRRFKRREVLRVGVRDIVGNAGLASVGRELSHLADACVEAALQSLEPTLPFAVFGLGRLGGCELSYASDIDVVFAYDGKTATEFDAAEKLATRLMRAIGDITSEGATFRVDARLRPEGNQGPLARSLDGYRTYYEKWGQTWEFQALTKARPIAGDAGVAQRFLEIVRPFVYRDPMPVEWTREIRRMKARIERERIPPGEDPRFHLKLGRGSLSDVEFTVQLEQLRRGAQHPEVRTTSTLTALDALVVAAALAPDDAEQLRAAYQLCERARNARVPADGVAERRAAGRRRRGREAGTAHGLRRTCASTAARRIPACDAESARRRRARVLRSHRVNRRREDAAMTSALEALPRDQLLAVAHEYMLVAMLANQATLPQTLVAGGNLDDLNNVAIDLWMGASTAYTHRLRALMGIEGDDVPAIMKALQLDVGFVHQYMDVRYQVNDPQHGEFWLEHCGALMNVEPIGEERVVGMCHTIEDPTFDATAFATNARARIRPIHRPPRVPADRHPHCHWTIEIDPENEPVGPARLTQQIGALPLVSLSIEPRPDGDGYQRAFDPKFRLADCSDGTLIALAREFSVQLHLLMCAAEVALAEHFGAHRAQALMADAWLATAWVVSERLRDLFGGGLDVARALAIHPALPPGFSRTVEADGDRVRCTLEPESAALLDRDQPGWIGALARGDARQGVEGIVVPIDRHAHVDDARVNGSKVVIDVTTNANAEPAAEPDVVAFMRIGMLSRWKFAL